MFFSPMRLRFNELLREHKLTPYKLARRSRKRISPSTAYRLSRVNGKVDLVSMDILDALCDVFDCKPADLFER